ncbi:GNAT family N-acetyltransferase [Nocardioides sp.]|uniref:GNAT family N-acetyltransferase n=1 Tax=Nocardioides sp. TaxID=35761 RepID=UPI001A301E11|nr:GNAT family N-acetyltransferase [Nocardioides sp.]MBJ7357338.1 GNAT family N-acetyltransferase [Nocardioides sp.]
MSIEIRDLDRHDEAQVRMFWEVERDAVADRPYNTFLAWEAARAYIPMEMPHVVRHFAAAWDGDVMVGALVANGPLTDNTHRAYADIAVHPAHQRRGIGTALLQEAEAFARAQGRRVLGSEAYAPVGGSSASLEFATRHGFVVALENGMKVVDIAKTRDRWDALAAECAPYHRDYEIRTVWAPIPDELVAGHNLVSNMFISEAPSGDLDMEDEVWDAERLRAQEERAAKAGRRDATTFALTSDGEVAAMTELFVNETAPHRGFQSGTLVVPAHRGHRLGLAIKVANQRAVADRFPELEWIITGNADVNAQMNAINDRLGFRVVERCLEIEKAL